MHMDLRCEHRFSTTICLVALTAGSAAAQPVRHDGLQVAAPAPVAALPIGLVAGEGPASDCRVILETFNAIFPADGPGYSVGWEAGYEPAVRFVLSADVVLCEIGLVLGHIAGPNAYTVHLYNNAGDLPGERIAGWRIINVPPNQPLSVPIDPTFFETGPLEVKAGVYWLSVEAHAQGGAGTYAALRGATDPRFAEAPMAIWSKWEPFWLVERTPAAAWRIEASRISDPFHLEWNGSCPGRGEFIASGATPDGDIAFVYGRGRGPTTVPPGAAFCPGTVLDLGGPGFGHLIAPRRDNAIFRKCMPERTHVVSTYPAGTTSPCNI